MKRRVAWGLVVIVGVVSVMEMAGAAEYAYTDLVRRLVDLRAVARLPEPGETCAQWSSYDRASVYDPQQGYVKWYANGDGNGFIRKEGDILVLAEMEGPGVIWRIWSAMPKEGHIRFYLDGAETPAIDLPFIGLFDRKHPPFDRPALVHMAARGQNCYVPIPYRKSCKIVADEGWGRYFQFTYTTFPKGTKVPTFRMPLSDEENAALDRADRIAARGGLHRVRGARVLQLDPQQVTKDRPLRVTLDGPRAVTALNIRGEFGDRDDQITALRELVLQITWDDETTPAVWSPLGDFFGTAPGINPYRGLPMGMTADGMYSNWFMPFTRRMRLEIRNEGATPRRLEVTIHHVPLDSADGWGRFHAKWHRDAFLPTDKARWPDWTLLKTVGRGRFCGVGLHVWNPRGGQCPEVAWCHGHYWWGEGDEKFFVDGEKFPSTFGTGTEDYFGYAWGSADRFENAFHNQPFNTGNKGHISNNRFHIADNIPFQTQFEAALEKYFPNHWPTVYDAIVWWYQAPGQADPYEPVPVADRLGYWPEIPVYRVKGAVEGESMTVLKKTAGNVTTQQMGGYGPDWSGLAQLWWTGAKPGDVLELALDVPKTGRYELRAQLTKAVDYGIVQLALDDKPAGRPIDAYNDGVVHTPELPLGTFDLAAGRHRLRVTITGKNPKAVPGYMFGLDYVKLVPAR